MQIITKHSRKLTFLSCIFSVITSGCLSSFPTGVLKETVYLTSSSYGDTYYSEPLGFVLQIQNEDNPEHVSPGHGRIFIFRPKEPSVKIVGLIFSINDEDVVIGDGGCFTWEQPVGPCQIRFERWLFDTPLSRGIHPLKNTQNVEDNISVQDGHFYFYRLDPPKKEDAGWQWCLTKLDETEGKLLMESAEKPVTLPKSVER